MVSFHLYECNSTISSLLMLYSALYNKKFQKNDGLLDNFKMYNYIALASDKLRQQADYEQKNSKQLSLNISGLLNYKKRVASLEVKLRKATEIKIELYSTLGESIINCNTLFTKGSDVYGEVQTTRDEIMDLLKINNKDFFLIKRAIFLEKIVLEQQSISPELSKALDEIITENQMPKDFEYTVETRKHKLNLFSSEHAVLMMSCSGPPFKITHVSGNYKDLFEANETKLVGSNVDQYMPAVIARNHDRFVLNYLNGREYYDTPSFIASCVKTSSSDRLTQKTG